MKKKSTFKFSLSPIMGCNPGMLRKLKQAFPIEKPYRAKWNKSAFINVIISLLIQVDRFRSRRLLKNVGINQPPIFIIGHWRSGTTYLHNLLCADPEAAYTTTYQTVFPNNLFAFQGILKWFMKIFLPSERPGDGLPLQVDQPQEEEFAIGNEIDYSFYYWMHFPLQAAYFRTIHFVENEIPKARAQQWKNNYSRLVKRALLNTGGSVFVSKNPPNTARIKWLLEIYPDAKFIFIHRDPYEVYSSTQKFFKGVIPSLQFQNFTEDLFDEHILKSYVMLHQSYFANKKLIPQENLMEVPYDQLIQNPDSVLKQIAKQFAFPNLERIQKVHQQDSKKETKHKIDQYKIDRVTLAKINDAWSDTFSRLGYAKREE